MFFWPGDVSGCSSFGSWQLSASSQKVSISFMCLCLCLCLCHCVCLFVGQDMSLHHSDQMSGRSEDNYIVFCMSINSEVLREDINR